MHQIQFDIPDLPFKISHADNVLLLGSCFSDEIGKKFQYFGFNSLSNPFGTVFHPLALSRFINESLDGVHEERIVHRNDVFLSWDAGSVCYSLIEDELKLKLQNARREWKDNLKSAKVLFVTFGTGWGYIERKSGQLVANCHKFPSNDFQKIFTTKEEIVKEWIQTVQKLHTYNPDLQIVFSVSPVRHIKDGLIENNRSKSNLLMAVSELSSLKNCHYFPSYEIVIDELRDYRFYKEDLVHPNDQAINYVWMKLSSVLLFSETQELCTKVSQLRTSTLHKLLHPESTESKAHIERTRLELQSFLTKNPKVKW